MRDHAPEVLSATTLIGNEVVNRDQKSLGKIEEIMIDRHTGHVAYAVLSFGGFLGMGDKLFAVPWQALMVDTNKKCCILDESEERLKAAPGFDKNDWPETADRGFLDQVFTYYSVDPYYGVIA